LRKGNKGRYCHRRSRAFLCNVYFHFVAHKRAQFHTLILSLAPPLHFPMRRNKCILYKTYLFYVQKRNCSLNKRLRNNRYKGSLSPISFRFGNRRQRKTRIAPKCRITERDQSLTILIAII